MVLERQFSGAAQLHFEFTNNIDELHAAMNFAHVPPSSARIRGNHNLYFAGILGSYERRSVDNSDRVQLSRSSVAQITAIRNKVCELQDTFLTVLGLHALGGGCALSVCGAVDIRDETKTESQNESNGVQPTQGAITAHFSRLRASSEARGMSTHVANSCFIGVCARAISMLNDQAARQSLKTLEVRHGRSCGLAMEPHTVENFLRFASPFFWKGAFHT